MHAEDMAEEFPVVTVDSNALDAARMLAEHRLPGIIVTDTSGRPYAVLPASQVVRFIVPTYVQDDPALARVLDEEFADAICDKLAEHTVEELVPKDRPALPVANDDDTVLELAAMMAANRSPLVAVLDGKGRDAALLGAVSVYDLLGRVLPAAPAD